MADPMHTATEWAAILPHLTPEAIRQWKRRGRIQPDGLNHRGHPVYRQLTIATAEAATAARARRI